jgi:hypothetical protein
MKRLILLRLIKWTTWLRKWLIFQLGEPTEERRPARTAPRDRASRPERRSRYVRAERTRSLGKIVDNYDNLPDDESIPPEDEIE